MRRAPEATITSMGGYKPPPYESNLCPKKHAGTYNQALTFEFNMQHSIMATTFRGITVYSRGSIVVRILSA